MTTSPHPDAQLLRGSHCVTSVGRYGLRRELGSGPSGTVYVGYDPEHGREVAINLMDSIEPASGHAARSIIEEEARAWAGLVHPNVVAVHDIGTYLDPRSGATGVYVAREMVPGLDLQRWIDARPSRGASAWVAVLDKFIDAGHGLAAAHRAGLVHRQFSPASVVVGYDGEVKLLDFSTFHARPVALVERSRPHYPAPELALGAPADARSDQYSFCAALWVALEQVTEGKIPARVAKVLARGLHAQPRERWPDMNELLRQLARRRPGWWRRSITSALTATAA